MFHGYGTRSATRAAAAAPVDAVASLHFRFVPRRGRKAPYRGVYPEDRSLPHQPVYFTPTNTEFKDPLILWTEETNNRNKSFANRIGIQFCLQIPTSSTNGLGPLNLFVKTPKFRKGYSLRRMGGLYKYRRLNPEKGDSCDGYLLSHCDVIRFDDFVEVVVRFHFQGPIYYSPRRVGDSRFFDSTWLLGFGSTTKSYLAFDSHRQEQLALKCITPKDQGEGLGVVLDEKLQTARLMSRLNHPYVVKFRGAWVDHMQGKLMLYEDFASGGDLHSLLESKDASSRINWSEARTMIQQLLEGVAHIHENNIIHGDLKPANILCASVFDKKQRIIITDFDLAADANRKGHKFDGGTNGYWGPEVEDTRLWSSYGKSADMWSVGVIVAEILTGFGPHMDFLKTYPRDRLKVENDFFDFGRTGPSPESDRAPWYTACDTLMYLNITQEARRIELAEPAERHVFSKLQCTDRIKDTVRELTRSDRELGFSEPNYWLLGMIVNEVVEKRWKEFPSDWFAIIECLLLKDFLAKLLHVNPRMRWPAKEALKHPFLTMSRAEFHFLDKTSNPGQYRVWGVLEDFWDKLSDNRLSPDEDYQWPRTDDPELASLGNIYAWAKVKHRTKDSPWAELNREHYNKLAESLQVEIERRKARPHKAFVAKGNLVEEL